MKKEVLLRDEKGRTFARAVRVGDHLYLSGMTGQWNLDTWEALPEAVGNVEVQARQVFEWMKRVLAHCGLSFDHVARLTTFIKNINDLPTVNAVRAQYLPRPTFVGTAIQVSGFIGTADLEIEAEAIYPD
ncbi:MAG: RidA family protein [Candidatus Tectomicrobia bacterium]|nr:RidA family protein [Candidatus Tectomicrobia bacterium]